LAHKGIVWKTVVIPSFPQSFGRELRWAIVTNLKEFFLEFDSYLAFVGEEYKITVGNEDYK
jgi:hypothetical protein